MVSDQAKVIIVSIVMFGTVKIFKSRHARLNPAFSALLIIMLIAYQLVFINIPGEYHLLRDSRQHNERIMNFVKENYAGKPNLLMCCASSKFWALKYGASNNFPQQQYYEMMGELYGSEQIYFVECWNDYFND